MELNVNSDEMIKLKFDEGVAIHISIKMYIICITE